MGAEPAEIVLADRVGHRAGRNQRIEKLRRHRHPPGRPVLGQAVAHQAGEPGGKLVYGRLAGNGHKPVDVHQQLDTAGLAVSRTGGRQPAVAGAAQDYVPQALELENRDDVVGVRAEADRLARSQMSPLAHPGKGWREGAMPVPAQDAGDGRPLPPAAPRAVHDDKRRHAAEFSRGT